eukprot:gene14241-5266_t
MAWKFCDHIKDSNGKDTFETDETIGEGKNTSGNDLGSEAVDHYKIDQKIAFDVFKDRYVDSTELDFSDKLGSSRRTGYDTRTVFEILGEAVAKETPHQKYQRLQHELQSFAEEIGQLTEVVESSAKDGQMSPVVLANEVSQLQKQLQGLHLEKVLGAQTLAGNAGLQGNWLGQVLNQLESFKSKPASKDPSEKDHVLYEMFCRPEHAKFSQTAKIAELEKRLKGMEDLIGKDSQKMTAIIAEPENTNLSLMDIVAVLRTKMSLFDPTNIDIVDTRLQGVLQHILQVGSKKEAVDNADKETKIAELYEMMRKWDGIAEIVPDLVDRLKALTSLHEQASTFAKSLVHLESTQSQIKDQLKSETQMLEKMEGNFADNMKAIQSNCESIDARITGLLEKIG